MSPVCCSVSNLPKELFWFTGLVLVTCWIPKVPPGRWTSWKGKCLKMFHRWATRRNPNFRLYSTTTRLRKITKWKININADKNKPRTQTFGSQVSLVIAYFTKFPCIFLTWFCKDFKNWHFWTSLFSSPLTVWWGRRNDLRTLLFPHISLCLFSIVTERLPQLLPDTANLSSITLWYLGSRVIFIFCMCARRCYLVLFEIVYSFVTTKKYIHIAKSWKESHCL